MKEINKNNKQLSVYKGKNNVYKNFIKQMKTTLILNLVSSDYNKMRKSTVKNVGYKMQNKTFDYKRKKPHKNVRLCLTI